MFTEKVKTEFLEVFGLQIEMYTIDLGFDFIGFFYGMKSRWFNRGSLDDYVLKNYGTRGSDLLKGLVKYRG